MPKLPACVHVLSSSHDLQANLCDYLIVQFCPPTTIVENTFDLQCCTWLLAFLELHLSAWCCELVIIRKSLGNAVDPRWYHGGATKRIHRFSLQRIAARHEAEDERFKKEGISCSILDGRRVILFSRCAVTGGGNGGTWRALCFGSSA